MSDNKTSPFPATYLSWSRSGIQIKGRDRFQRAEVGSGYVTSVR